MGNASEMISTMLGLLWKRAAALVHWKRKETRGRLNLFPLWCSEWGSEGREFKSHRPDHLKTLIFNG